MERAMNTIASRRVPPATTLVVGALLAVAVGALGGCIGGRGINTVSGPGMDPAVVANAPTAPQSPARIEAVADMRARAEADDKAPFPDVFQSARLAELASRGEPRPVGEVKSVQAELSEIARRRQAATDPAELAALKAREAKLRRLAATKGGALR